MAAMQGMLAETRRYQMGSDGCTPVAVLLDNRRYQVRSDGCAPHRMLVDTRRYQMGSEACLPDRMLAETRRYHMASDEEHSIADASANFPCEDAFATPSRILKTPENLKSHA